MKNLLLIAAILFSSTTFAQELIINKVDDFTGSSKKRTKNYNVGYRDYGRLMAYTVKVNDSYGVGFYTSNLDLGCSGTAKSYVTFLFADKTTLTLKNDVYDIECSAGAESMFALVSSELETLKTKQISKIRFSQSKYFADFIVSGKYTIKQLLEVLR
jgi:hypothetical protein